MIDLILLGVIVAIIAAALGGWQVSVRTTTVGTATVYYLNTLWSESLLAIVSAVYCIAMWSQWQATVGQRLLGLRVIEYENSAHSWIVRVAIRWVVLYAWTFLAIASYFDASFTVYTGIWLASLLFSTMRSENRRGLHDRLSGTVVIQSFG